MSSSSISQQYSDQAATSYTDLRSTLRKLKTRSELLRYSGGLLSWLGAISLLLLGLALLGGMLQLPAAVRVSMIVILVGCAIWAGYAFIVRAILRRTSIERIAFKIEQSHPELQDRLISSLQLWPELSENKYGYATDFIARVVEEAGASLSKIDTSEVLTNDRKEFKRGIVMMAALLPLIISIAFYPSTWRDSLYTFVHPFEGGEQPIPIEITHVTPGDHTLELGENVDIIADVTGPAPPTALLYHRTGEEEWGAISMHGVEKDADRDPETRFTTRLQNIKEPLEYYVSVADAQSPQYSIKVIQKPIIDSLQLELRYPRYTGLPPKSLDKNVGDVVAILGTKVVLEATSSKDVASAFMVFDGKTKTRLEAGDAEEPGKMTGSFIIQQSGRYHIAVTDTEGQSNSEPIEYSVNALADQPPRISIVQPGRDVNIGEDMIIPLQIEAQDDYGVAVVNLHYRIEGQDEEHTVQLWDDDPQTGVFLEHLWSLAPLQLFPEDVVSYYAEAADADNISGPNTGRSAVFIARFPSLYELYKQTELEQELEQAEMVDIRARQEEVKDMVDDLVEELKKEKELDWAGEKELEQAAELQKQIKEEMEKLAEEISETVEKMEKNPLIDSETLEKLQELRDLIDEVATDEMKQIMRKLAEALEKVNPTQQQKDLMSASFRQEEFMEKLDSMIDLFKKMQLKQRLEVAANQAEELVRQQAETLEKTEQLAEKSVNDPAESEMLADREERIAKQTEQLLGDLNELAEEMKEKFSNIADFLKQSTEKAQQCKIPDQLRKASSELKNMNPSASASCQKSAMSNMSELQEDLQQAVEAMEGQDACELIAGLSGAIRSSLYLSHQHEEVIHATTAFNNTSKEMLAKEREMIDSLAADEIDLAEGAQKVAKQLKDLSHETTSVRPELVWKMARVADGMKRAAAAMEDKLPTLARPIQKNTLAALNSAIEDMLESIDQINAQAMPMMGMEDYMEQLRQLAEQQSQVNQSTQDAESMQRRQGRTPSVEEMLEKLSIEQSLIREATERLAGKLDKLAETLGRLEELAKEMRDVEEGLGKERLSRSTIEKQRRILTRLLEYEKSLKKQDFSKQREARVGRTYTAEQPTSSLPTDATAIRKQLDTMSSPSAQERWPTQYRELIRMYYKALSNTIRTQK